MLVIPLVGSLVVALIVSLALACASVVSELASLLRIVLVLALVLSLIVGVLCEITTVLTLGEVSSSTHVVATVGVAAVLTLRLVLPLVLGVVGVIVLVILLSVPLLWVLRVRLVSLHLCLLLVLIAALGSSWLVLVAVYYVDDAAEYFLRDMQPARSRFFVEHRWGGPVYGTQGQ